MVVVTCRRRRVIISAASWNCWSSFSGISAFAFERLLPPHRLEFVQGRIQGNLQVILIPRLRHRVHLRRDSARLPELIHSLCASRETAVVVDVDAFKRKEPSSR